MERSSKVLTAVISVLAITAIVMSGITLGSLSNLNIVGNGGEGGADGVDGIDGIDGVNGVNGQDGTTLVTLWDDLEKNTTNGWCNDEDDFLLQFEDNLWLDNEYVRINSATNFSLTRDGIYKITLKLLLIEIDYNEYYYVSLYKSGILDEYFYCFRYITATIETKQIISVLYVNASSIDYFEIRAHCSTTDIDGFDLSGPNFNQLAIEYLLS
ncbi:MAG: hypothetical protein JW891_13745 [Candidatus Lokiarchaeota archaeon]|nr:hypothetical protein [Candidatus Lokiarchaeota archaeon]